ncbi:uncharacterized protein LOC114842178 isoform X1 [Betta splendens]|uniref:Uncharacterized protein LOC114842178 isoform X1 n=1 Tax=Betta splendens TaxID=158456 RepID=A0A6P7KST3_BETSP|nr:uncharacterized protein LOC114842178 isoform X1 [Betta splendens]
MEDGPNGSTDSGEYKVADMTDVIREKKKRPRRKLCYLTNKKSSSKQWKDKLSLEDIDGMFDDLDSSSPGNDISPLQDTDESDQSKRGISPVLQKRSLIVKLPGSGRDILNFARRSLAPELENGKNKYFTEKYMHSNLMCFLCCVKMFTFIFPVAALNVPFKLHEPVKTSSLIQEKLVLEATVEEDNERALVVPQVLDFEEPNTDLVTITSPSAKHTSQRSYKTSVTAEFPAASHWQEDPSLAHRMHSVRSINQDPAGLHDDPVQPVSDAAALSKHQRIDDSIPGPGRFQPVLLFQPPTSPLTTTGHGR